MLFTLSGMTPYDYHAFLPLAQPLAATLKVPTTTAALVMFSHSFPSRGRQISAGKACSLDHRGLFPQDRARRKTHNRAISAPAVLWPNHQAIHITNDHCLTRDPCPGGPKGTETLRSPHGLRRPFFGVHSNISIWGAVSGRSPVSRWKETAVAVVLSWQLAHIHWHSRATAVHLGLFCCHLWKRSYFWRVHAACTLIQLSALLLIRFVHFLLVIYRFLVLRIQVQYALIPQILIKFKFKIGSIELINNFDQNSISNSITGWWFGCHQFYFPIYLESHHPNWRTHIFQRGGPTTNQV